MMNVRWLTLAAMITAAAATRLMPHPPNFSPIAAMALFAGAHFTSRRAAFAVPLGAMILSDIALAAWVYGTAALGSRPWVYAAFALTVCLGLLIRRRRNFVAVTTAALSGSVLFFLITNFAVWLGGKLYPMTLAGLGQCYLAAIPFFRNTVAGDLFFTAMLFGGFYLAERRFAVLREPALH